MKILTTLAENDYFLGLAALINSVVKHGLYVDVAIVGYRGPLPEWLPPLTDTQRGKTCILKSGLVLELIQLENSVHMVHEKPKWFKHLTEVLEPDAEEYFFFDSDIILINRMSFFGEWVKQGVALCEDVNYDMANDHPIRKQWIGFAKEGGLLVNKSLNRFYNSGFLGWTSVTKEFVTDWERSFGVLSLKSGDMKKFRVFDRTYPVQSANQDSFNLAAMITNVPLSTMGRDAMGFQKGPKLMLHPLGPKPWKRKFVSEFFSGNPPRNSDVAFWENVNGTELQPFKPSKVRAKIAILKLLKGFARIYKRI